MGLGQVAAVVVVTKSVLSKFRKKSVRVLLLALSLISFNWAALADSTLSLYTHYYDLTPGLTIAKPIISYENNITLETTVNAKFTVDRVTTNYDDYDSLSGASQYTGELNSSVDTRQEYLAGVSHTIGYWKLDAGYLLSTEEDYRSHAPSIGLAKDFNQRNTTLAFGYAHNFDTVKGRYLSKEKNKDVDSLSLVLTQVLSPKSIMQLGYTLQYNQGYLSTGNRQIVLENELTYDEYLPTNRSRQAIGLRLAYWLPTKTAFHFGYRLYQDDWQLGSNTLEFKAYQTINRQWQLRAEARIYSQTAVDFMKDSYDGSERYLTSASSLKAFSSQLYGVRASYKPKVFPKTQFQFKYERYRQSTGLYGDIVMLSVDTIY